MAAGRTNREVAEQLVLSTRTIEAHLRNIYGKLGVRSRVELARAAVDGSTRLGGYADGVSPPAPDAASRNRKRPRPEGSPRRQHVHLDADSAGSRRRSRSSRWRSSVSRFAVATSGANAAGSQPAKHRSSERLVVRGEDTVKDTPCPAGVCIELADGVFRGTPVGTGTYSGTTS